jgi:hypothetical protein
MLTRGEEVIARRDTTGTGCPEESLVLLPIPPKAF